MQDTLETLVQPLGREDPLEEGMATHSSILAWSSLWGSYLEHKGRMDTCMCMAESLCCPSETNRVPSHFSHVQLLATPWTIAHQAPLSTGFSSLWVFVFSLFPSVPLQVELHVHLDGAIKPETILYYGR